MDLSRHCEVAASSWLRSLIITRVSLLNSWSERVPLPRPILCHDLLGVPVLEITGRENGIPEKLFGLGTVRRDQRRDSFCLPGRLSTNHHVDRRSVSYCGRTLRNARHPGGDQPSNPPRRRTLRVRGSAPRELVCQFRMLLVLGHHAHGLRARPRRRSELGDERAGGKLGDADHGRKRAVECACSVEVEMSALSELEMSSFGVYSPTSGRTQSPERGRADVEPEGPGPVGGGTAGGGGAAEAGRGSSAPWHRDASDGSSPELCVKVRGSSSMLRLGCLGDLLRFEKREIEVTALAPDRSSPQSNGGDEAECTGSVGEGAGAPDSTLDLGVQALEAVRGA